MAATEKHQDGLQIKAFKDQAAFRSWLDKNHAKADGLWIKMAKKSSGIPTIDWGQAVDELLCFGWIDAKRIALDDTHFLQRVVPRRPKSTWSKINVDRVAALIKAKKMTPAGMAEVKKAKADGRWDNAYAGQKTAEFPEDLVKAIAKNKKAAAFFPTINSASRYAFVFRLHHAKPELREAKIKKFVDMLADGKTFH